MIAVTSRALLALTFAVAIPLSAHAHLHKTSDDANIASSIETALDAYPQFGGTSSIQVQAIGHIVYLHGLVDTYMEKTLVQSVAEKTPGVERVVNSIELQNE